MRKNYFYQTYNVKMIYEGKRIDGKELINILRDNKDFENEIEVTFRIRHIDSEITLDFVKYLGLNEEGTKIVDNDELDVEISLTTVRGNNVAKLILQGNGNRLNTDKFTNQYVLPTRVKNMLSKTTD